MDLDSARQLLEACRRAGRIDSLMPRLPAGVAPRHLHALDAVIALEAHGGAVRVSDVGARLGLTRPTVTRSLSDLAALGHVAKATGAEDARNVVVSSTAAGRALHERYDLGFHARVAELLAGLPDEDVATAIRVVDATLGALTGAELLPEPVPADGAPASATTPSEESHA